MVEDGAAAVDDFLVALDLRHDLLLYLQRRQGDFYLGEHVAVELWLSPAGRKVSRLFPILFRLSKRPVEFWQEAILWESEAN